MTARILVVDDDDATRAGMVEFLQRSGYEAAGVGSFEEARKTLRADTPDLLITDIRLREYNGLQLLIWMPTPVRAIVVTGFPDPVLEAEARAQGAPVLVKPIVPGVLVKAIEDALALPPGATKRRWIRKRVTTPVPADVNGTAARIVDISYGGVRVELEREPERDIEHRFTMAVADVVLPVNLVWDRAEGEHGWTCGLAVTTLNQQASDTWYGLVDRLA